MFHRRKNRRRRSFKERLSDVWESVCALVGRVGPWIVLAVVAVAVPYLVYFGYHRVVSSPYFQISEIDIRGAKHAEVDKLATRAGLAHGINIFEVEPAAIRSVFESSPWVREVRVERQLPDGVVVTIRERRPAALLVGEQYTLVDADGNVIEGFDARPPERFLSLPLVTGLSPDALERERGAKLLRETIRVADMYARMGLDDARPLSEIHADPVVGLTLMTEDLGTEIRLGRGDYRRRLERLRSLRPSLEERDIDPAYILLDQNDSLDRVTVGRRRSQGLAAGEADENGGVAEEVAE